MSFRSTNLPSQPDVPFPTGTSRLFGAPCRIMPSAINRMGTAIPVAIFGVMTLRHLIESSSNCGSYLCTPIPNRSRFASFGTGSCLVAIVTEPEARPGLVVIAEANRSSAAFLPLYFATRRPRGDRMQRRRPRRKLPTSAARPNRNPRR